MRLGLSTRSIGGLVDREAVVFFRDEPAVVVDAPSVEEKGPPALPTARRHLVNLETFMVVFVVVVLLISEVHVPFVLEVGLVVGGGWAAMRIRISLPDEVV